MTDNSYLGSRRYSLGDRWDGRGELRSSIVKFLLSLNFDFDASCPKLTVVVMVSRESVSFALIVCLESKYYSDQVLTEDIFFEHE